MNKLQPYIILLAAKIGVVFLLLLETCCATFAREGDNKAVLIEDVLTNSAARLILSTPNTLEATVRLEFKKLQNAETSIAVPADIIVSERLLRKELLTVKAKDAGSWNFQFNYRFKIGLRSEKSTIDFVYSLPYSSSQKFAVSQGACGKYTHLKGSQNENAVDFRMPEGTRILASRPGFVVSLRDDSKSGGPTKEFAERENLVVIKHEDGTYASYAHLKHKGVLVTLGQSVVAGTPIGLSGSTGWATEPHLHFMVYRVIDSSKIESLPFRMNTSKGILGALKEGETY